MVFAYGFFARRLMTMLQIVMYAVWDKASNLTHAPHITAPSFFSSSFSIALCVVQPETDYSLIFNGRKIERQFDGGSLFCTVIWNSNSRKQGRIEENWLNFHFIYSYLLVYDVENTILTRMFMIFSESNWEHRSIVEILGVLIVFSLRNSLIMNSNSFFCYFNQIQKRFDFESTSRVTKPLISSLKPFFSPEKHKKWPQLKKLNFLKRTLKLAKSSWIEMKTSNVF